MSEVVEIHWHDEYAYADNPAFCAISKEAIIEYAKLVKKSVPVLKEIGASLLEYEYVADIDGFVRKVDGAGFKPDDQDYLLNGPHLVVTFQGYTKLRWEVRWSGESIYADITHLVKSS